MNPEISLPNFPKEFIDNVTLVCGQTGEEWLRNIPEIVREIESEWEIEVRGHFSNLTYNYVGPAVSLSGESVVLKLGLPVRDTEIYSEAEFLRYANGNGAVRLIREDRERRALLIEHAFPGTELKIASREDPDSAANIAAELLSRVVLDPPMEYEHLIDLNDWFKKLKDANDGEFPRDIAEKALRISEGQDADSVRLIHGDFHHTNILLSGEQFLVIDPKGVIGDVRYDIAVFLNNHLWYAENKADRTAVMNRAVSIFADRFGFSHESIIRWAFAQVALSAYWTYTEKNEHWRRQLALAEFWNV